MVSAVLFALLAAGCASPWFSVIVENAVVARSTGVIPAMLYFSVRNPGPSSITLTGVTMDGGDSTAILTTRAHRLPGTAMSMSATDQYEAVDSLAIAAGQTVRFAPGGYFVAIRTLRRPLARGDSITVTLHFASGASRQVAARVVDYAELDVSLASSGTPVGTTSPPTADDGRALYRANGCAACHGAEGYGDGPVGRTLAPPPRDFRSAVAFRNGSDVAAIAQTLATGIPAGGSMPLYAHLTDSERRSIALYVISLRRSSPSPDSSP